MRRLRFSVAMASWLLACTPLIYAQAPLAVFHKDAVVVQSGMICQLELVTPEVVQKVGDCAMIVRIQAAETASFPAVMQNPFLDPSRQSICQIAVFDSNGQYLGNLLRWCRNRAQAPPVTQLFHNVIPASSVGRVVHVPPTVEAIDARNRRVEVALSPGTYQLRAILYQSLFGGDSEKVVAESDLVILQVTAHNVQTSKEESQSSIESEFWISQQGRRVILEYRNLSKDQLEIGPFGFYPALQKSPGYTILNGLDDEQYATEPIRFAGVSTIEFKPDRQLSAVIPPYGLISVDADISEVAYYSPLNVTSIQYVATKSFFNKDFYTNPENPYTANPNNAVYARSNVLRLTEIVPARNQSIR
jgi:hypothetical protein